MRLDKSTAAVMAVEANEGEHSYPDCIDIGVPGSGGSRFHLSQSCTNVCSYSERRPKASAHTPCAPCKDLKDSSQYTFEVTVQLQLDTFVPSEVFVGGLQRVTCMHT